MILLDSMNVDVVELSLTCLFGAIVVVVIGMLLIKPVATWWYDRELKKTKMK